MPRLASDGRTTIHPRPITRRPPTIDYHPGDPSPLDLTRRCPDTLRALDSARAQATGRRLIEEGHVDLADTAEGWDWPAIGICLVLGVLIGYLLAAAVGGAG